MAIERTLSIIKPDGVEKGFYAVHKARPFFGDLVKSMTSGPVVLMVLEGEAAVAKNREIMGATDPKKAADGTLRKDFATDIEKNTVHGSDSVDNAKIEVSYFFPEIEVHPYEWKKVAR